jgi:hypothetical protein
MKLPNASVGRVVANLRKAKLGDPRRSRRLVRVVSKLAKHPQASLPDVLDSAAELEGGYRLVNNRWVTLAALHEAHAAETARRAREVGLVLAIHDTTSCQFSHADPTVVGYLNTGKPGFYAHYTLVAAAHSLRPLGISHLETSSRMRPPQRRARAGSSRKKKAGAETRRKPNRAFKRWRRGIEESETGLRGCQVIHIADRESDSYELMHDARQMGARFVFRVRIGDRNAQTESGDTLSIETLMASHEGVLTREVALATRKPQSAPQQARVHPARKARIATLRFSAAHVAIRRPRYLGRLFPAILDLNVVRVWEPDPPSGQEPVEWLLYTTEPVDTSAQIAAVVDMYRARWLIEECNKALKSGCLYEARQFDSLDALRTMLAMSLPIACEILALRTAARENRDCPGTDILSPLQIQVLRRLGSIAIPPQPTLGEVLLAVAAMGGHQRSNGEPGWLVLQRGMSKLHAYEAGWRAARDNSADL